MSARTAFRMDDPCDFVRYAAGFEAALAVAAVAVGWASGVGPPDLEPTSRTLLVGTLATLPLVGLYFLADRVRLRSFRRIHRLLLRTLGRPLAACRWYELALLAALAGICEELLFRGVLQPWLGRLGEPAGWIGANVLFGLAHAVTPLYAALAGLVGLFLSGVQAAGGNVLAPMLAHGLYDWFAFAMVARDYRRRTADRGGSRNGREAA